VRRPNLARIKALAREHIALFPDDGTDADTLFRNAFYASKMTDTVAGSLGLENQLRQAVDKGEFVLHYQPKVHLVSADPRSGAMGAA
jgi:hypothetical protein